MVCTQREKSERPSVRGREGPHLSFTRNGASDALTGVIDAALECALRSAEESSDRGSAVRISERKAMHANESKRARAATNPRNG